MSLALLSKKSELVLPAKARATPAGLRAGEPNDSFEQEADRVADEVTAGGAPQWELSRVGIGSPLQRKCACGGSGECDSCKEEEKVQRKSQGGAPSGMQAPSSGLPVAARAVVQSSGQPLDTKTREDMEGRFGFDFSRVRIHAGAQAADSAAALGALAYTTGRHIVFGSGKYEPHSPVGRKLLAHELAHVVQQGAASVPAVTEPAVQRSSEGAYRIAVAPVPEPQDMERQADLAAERATGERADRPPIADGILSGAAAQSPALQRVRIPVPNTPLCGKTLTHIDVLPPAVKDLEPCLPKGVPVTRINIVGRDLTKPTPGLGNQVFNLHIGYYKDSAGRYCGVIRDSKVCVAPACQFLPCAPTLKEVLDAIIEVLKDILIILGVIALAILIALIIELLGPILAPAAALASTQGEPGAGGGQPAGGSAASGGVAAGGGTGSGGPAEVAA
jgi:hypothetical protein